MNKNMPLISSFFMMSFVALFSSQNWFFLWTSMEINTFSFITFLFFLKTMKKDTLVLFFSIQTICSLSMLLAFFLLENKMPNISEMTLLILLSMLFKMGVAPFHNWSIPVGISCSSVYLIIFLSLQKIFPFFVVKTYTNFMYSFFTFVFWTSIIWGSTQNLSQSSMKNIIMISSVSQLGWMMISLSLLQVWEFFFIVYSLNLCLFLHLMNKKSTNLFISKNKAMIIFLFMSLGGVPPLLGFFPKILAMKISFLLDLLMTIFVMVVFSLLDLYVYLRLSMLTMFKAKKTLIWLTLIKWNLNMMIIANLSTLLMLNM